MSSGAAEHGPRATITTSGMGEVRGLPDRAVVQVVVERHAATAAEASSQAGAGSTAVLKSLEGVGGAATEARVSGFTVAPNYSYQPERRLVDYVARATIEIAVQDFTRFGALFDAVLDAGATEVGEPAYETSQHAALKAMAVAMAFRLAEDEATSMATAARGSLGRVLTMTSGQPHHGVMYQAKADRVMMASAGGAPSPERDVVVVAQVTAQWEFEPGAG